MKGFIKLGLFAGAVVFGFFSSFCGVQGFCTQGEGLYNPESGEFVEKPRNAEDMHLASFHHDNHIFRVKPSEKEALLSSFKESFSGYCEKSGDLSDKPLVHLRFVDCEDCSCNKDETAFLFWSPKAFLSEVRQNVSVDLKKRRLKKGFSFGLASDKDKCFFEIHDESGCVARATCGWGVDYRHDLMFADVRFLDADDSYRDGSNEKKEGKRFKFKNGKTYKLKFFLGCCFDDLKKAKLVYESNVEAVKVPYVEQLLAIDSQGIPFGDGETETLKLFSSVAHPKKYPLAYWSSVINSRNKKSKFGGSVYAINLYGKYKDGVELRTVSYGVGAL